MSNRMMDNSVESTMAVWTATVNTFDDSAVELIIRSAQGNLRLCQNLCYGSLIDAARQNTKIVSIRHVNAVLVQPHWRSHEELITQQTA